MAEIIVMNDATSICGVLLGASKAVAVSKANVFAFQNRVSAIRLGHYRIALETLSAKAATFFNTMKRLSWYFNVLSTSTKVKILLAFYLALLIFCGGCSYKPDRLSELRGNLQRVLCLDSLICTELQRGELTCEDAAILYRMQFVSMNQILNFSIQ